LQLGFNRDVVKYELDSKIKKKIDDEPNGIWFFGGRI